ncbi:MAG: hypothetical protein LBU34_14250 [Planctomycetaceae bacterium]|nr:hypothetical protein [Planctomycetaceae bacterium]
MCITDGSLPTKGRQSLAERLRRRQPTVNLYNVGCFACLSASDLSAKGFHLRSPTLCWQTSSDCASLHLRLYTSHPLRDFKKITSEIITIAVGNQLANY